MAMARDVPYLPFPSDKAPEGRASPGRTINRRQEVPTVQNPINPETAQQDVFRFLSTIPSEAFVYAMLGSVIASAVMYLTGRRHTALFIGEWAPTFIAIGLFYKLLRPSGRHFGERLGEALTR